MNPTAPMSNRVMTTTNSSFGSKKKKRSGQKQALERLQAQQMNPGQQQYEGPTEGKSFGP